MTACWIALLEGDCARRSEWDVRHLHGRTGSASCIPLCRDPTEVTFGKDFNELFHHTHPDYSAYAPGDYSDDVNTVLSDEHGKWLDTVNTSGRRWITHPGGGLFS